MVGIFLMEINNKNSSERVKAPSFIDWAKENNQLIVSQLMDAGIAFLNEQAENLKQPVFRLEIDNRWHYLDKPTKKQSYRASLLSDSDGIPYLALTYFTFRHGSYSEKFNSKQVLKELWMHERAGRPIAKTPAKPSNKPLVEKANPPITPIDWVASDLGLWHSMELCGISHYLKRKGLNDLVIPGLRYAKNQVAVAIINTNNEFQGL